MVSRKEDKQSIKDELKEEEELEEEEVQTQKIELVKRLKMTN